VAWDSDSGKVGVDCQASACMSNRIQDFLPGTLKPCNKRVQTFGGHHVGNIQMETIHWEVQADDGEHHVFEIPKSYYIPEGGARLLSPQHWSKTRPKADQVKGMLARSVVTGRNARLEWNKRQSGIELKHDSKTNVFDLVLAPGVQAYIKASLRKLAWKTTWTRWLSMRLMSPMTRNCSVQIQGMKISGSGNPTGKMIDKREHSCQRE